MPKKKKKQLNSPVWAVAFIGLSALIFIFLPGIIQEISCHPKPTSYKIQFCEGIFNNGVLTGVWPSITAGLVSLAIGFYFIYRAISESK